jgi:hypothetical protein
VVEITVRRILFLNRARGFADARRFTPEHDLFAGQETGSFVAICVWSLLFHWHVLRIMRRAAIRRISPIW